MPCNGLTRLLLALVILAASHRPAAAQNLEWVFESRPAAAIGTADGPPETLLFRATHAFRLSSGVIVIGNAGTHELRFYDAGGKHLKSVGREGEGPGEFATMSRAWRIRGDTIQVWDTRLHRMSWFAPDGKFLRSQVWAWEPIPLTDGARLTNPLSFLGVLADGSVIARSNPVAARPITTPVGLNRIPVTVLVYSPLGQLRDTVGKFLDTEGFIYESVIRRGGPQQKGFSPVIFGEQFLIASGGASIAVGKGKPYAIQIYDPTGKSVRTVQRATAETQATPEHVRRFKEWEVAALPPESRALREESIKKVPSARTLPAYRGLEFDRDGNLWVEEYWMTKNDPRQWSIFDLNGRWLGRIVLPHELEILDLGSDYVLGRVRDELGVEQIRLHRIRRAGSSGG
jgi:hypothetical protein